VDKEFMLYFDSINEGESWLLDENLKRCQDPAECKRLLDAADPDFEESLKKDSINGNSLSSDIL
jgi:retron-type reverse transcriptase